jgi:hypothetical protein
MSFRCQVTGRLSFPGDKLNKIVALTRPQTYKHWDEEAEENWETTGSEIVLELNATNAGVELWDSWNADQRAEFLKQFGRLS